MIVEHGDLGWTFYGVLYSALLFWVGTRIQNKRGPCLSAIGLQAFGVLAICIDLYRTGYYAQWVALPFVAGTLVIEIITIVRIQRAQTGS